jgi:undecaprenyl-diphosphatase
MLAMKSLLPEFARRRLDPAQRYGLRLTLFAAALSLVGIPFAWLVVEVMQKGELDTWDKSVSERLFEIKLQFPFLSDAFNLISHLGQPVWFWFLVGATCIFLWRRNQRKLIAFLLTSTIGGSLVNTAVKLSVDRARPTFRDPEAITFQTGKSFPSGHSMSSTIAYGAILLIFLPLIPARRRKWAFVAYGALVLVIGIARLGLGVHYVSDVVGGYMLGLAWLTLSTAAFEIWREERGKPAVRPMAKGVEPDAAPDLKPAPP